MKRLLAPLLACLVILGSAEAAVAPEERLADPALEARARDLSKGLRCLVCQNQSIDDSNAPLAQDLRRIVRERLVAGDDEAAIEAFLVARYGEFVLLAPPVRAGTLLLWAGPFILLLGAAGALAWLTLRRRSRSAAGANEGADERPLDANETRELDALLAPERSP